MSAADDPIDFGAPARVVRIGGLSMRVRTRGVLVSATIAVLLIAAAVIAMCLGEFLLSAGEVLSALTGGQTGIVETIVVEWRAPRVLGAAVFGAALGVSGAIFQSLTRNPLASPDIIGLSSGSYVGALISIILLGGGTVLTATGSIVGGLLTAGLGYVLAYRGGVQGFRLIIVGIALSAMLGAVSTYLILRASLEVAMVAAVWGAGSLTPIGWAEFTPAALVIVASFAGLVALAAPMRQMEMGDDAARALGVRIEPARLGLVVIGVALTSAVTAFAGPITFIALAAPQIARRIVGAPGTALVPAGFVGAFLLLVSDIVAQHLLPTALPVGIVTIVIGGGYLVWLLVHEARKRP